MTKAYISATYEDLKECRLAVKTALERLDLGHRTMEGYVAEDIRPVDRCLEDVDSCDIYIGIFAFRYGYVPAGQTKSITHLEYEHAANNGKECLIFLLHDKALWPVDQVDRGPTAASVDKLRSQLSARHVCNFFVSAEELALKVISSLTRYIASHPADEKPATPEPEATETPRMGAQTRAQYLERLSQRYGGVGLEAPTQQLNTGANPSVDLPSVFVEPLVREVQPAEIPREVRRRERINVEDLPDGLEMIDVQEQVDYHEKPAVPVLDVLCSADQRRLVLLGDPGSGKSTVVRLLALALAGLFVDERVVALGDALPIVVEMRSYAAFLATPGNGPGFVDYLVHQADAHGYRTEPRALKDHLERGEPAVVIFDGLDEIIDKALRTETADRIAAFASEFSNARVVVTSRGPEYPRSVFAGASFAHHTLQDLTPARTTEFLDRWFRQTMPDKRQAMHFRDLVASDIGRSRELTELAGNPMLLSILAIIGKRWTLPRQRWNLYDRAATVLVERWNATRLVNETHDPASFVDVDDKRELLRRVALYMQSGHSGLGGNYIDSERLKEIFADYLQHRYAMEAAAATAAAVTLIAQLRERDFILTFFGPHGWGFVHRTFLEFFSAWAIVREFETHRLTFDDVKQIFLQHWADTDWHEVLRLVAARLEGPLTAELAGVLLTQVDRGFPPTARAGGPDTSPRDPPWNIALAVQCVAEMRPITEGSVAEQALKHVERLIEYCATVHDPATAALIGDEVLPAVDGVAPNWPGRLAYLSWYRGHAAELLTVPVATHAARLAAMLARPEDLVERAFAATATSLGAVRLVCAAVAGLAEVIRQAARRQPGLDTSATRDRLVELAKVNDRVAVRTAAVQSLGTLPGGDNAVRDVLVDRAVRDPAPPVRLTAVQSVVEAFPDDPAIITTLLGRLRSDPAATVRRAIARAVTRSRRLSSDVERALLDVCRQDEDAEVVEVVAQALLVRPNTVEEVRAVVADRLTSDVNPRVRRAAVRLIGSSGSEDVLIARIGEDSDRVVVRESARMVVARQGVPVERVRDALIARLGADGDESMRAMVVEVLHDVCGHGDLVDGTLAAAAVHDPSNSVRLAALGALAGQPAADRRRALFTEVAIQDPDQHVRLVAVQALSSDVDVPATAALAAIAVGDQDLDVRVHAIRGLGLAGRDLDPSIGPQLVELIDGANHPEIRLAALDVLKNTRPPGVDLEAVLRNRAMHDAVTDVFTAAAAAAMENVASVAELWQVIATRAADDKNPEIRSAAVALLGQAAGFGEALTVLTGRLRHDPDPAVISAAASAVAALAPESARDLLMGRLTAADPDLRSAVIQALQPWITTDPDARAAIIEQAQTATTADVRRTAVETLAPAIGRRDVQEAVERCAKDDELPVREAAERLLKLRPI